MGMFHLTSCYVIDYPLVLHPHHKLHYFKMAGWEDSWIKTAHAIVCDEFDRTYVFMDVDYEAGPPNKVREQLIFYFCKLTASI